MNSRRHCALRDEGTGRDGQETEKAEECRAEFHEVLRFIRTLSLSLSDLSIYRIAGLRID